jgi:hypothetical protein
MSGVSLCSLIAALFRIRMATLHALRDGLAAMNKK